MSTPVNTDDLPPTQYLILEVLAARHRTGEALWTFPSRLRWVLLALADIGLIGVKSGVAPRTMQAWLTDAGRAAVLMEGYETPAEHRVRKLAEDMKTWCSPHGVATRYAERVLAALEGRPSTW